MTTQRTVGHLFKRLDIASKVTDWNTALGHIDNKLGDHSSKVMTDADTASEDEAVVQSIYVEVTSSGSLTATRKLLMGERSTWYAIYNNTTGGQSIEIHVRSSSSNTSPSGGSSATIANGKTRLVYTQCDLGPDTSNANRHAYSMTADL